MRLRKVVVILGFTVLGCMGLYPPWIATYDEPFKNQEDLQKRVYERFPQKPSETAKETADRDAEFERLRKLKELTVVKDAGYHFIFENPGRDVDISYRLFNAKVAAEDRYYEPNLHNAHELIAYSVNTTRLIVQWVCAALLTLGLLWTTKSKAK